MWMGSLHYTASTTTGIVELSSTSCFHVVSTFRRVLPLPYRPLGHFIHRKSETERAVVAESPSVSRTEPACLLHPPSSSSPQCTHWAPMSSRDGVAGTQKCPKGLLRIYAPVLMALLWRSFNENQCSGLGTILGKSFEGGIISPFYS